MISGDHAIWNARMAQIRRHAIMEGCKPMAEAMRKIEQAFRVSFLANTEKWAESFRRLGEEISRITDEQNRRTTGSTAGKITSRRSGDDSGTG